MIQRHHTEGGAYLWESCMEASAPPLPPCSKMVLNGLLGSILPTSELRGWQSRLLGLGVLALLLSLLLVTPERKPHMMASIEIPIKLLKQLDLINIVRKLRIPYKLFSVPGADFGPAEWKHVCFIPCGTKAA